MKLHPVGPHIDELAFEIGIDQTVTGSDIAPAVSLVETKSGKFE